MTNRSTLTIPAAAEILGITGRVSLNGIHARFHELVKEWHPDVSEHDPDLSHTTFIHIKEATIFWWNMA
jgi:DnaJ-class molecular chaperone